MEIFKISEYKTVANPEPGSRYAQQLLEGKADNVTGIFVTLPPGGGTTYHFHRKRESIIIVISGEAVETVEGKDIPIRAEDVLFIPAGQKHAMVNNSGGEVRYLEFQVGDPAVPDFVETQG